MEYLQVLHEIYCLVILSQHAISLPTSPWYRVKTKESNPPSGMCVIDVKGGNGSDGNTSSCTEWLNCCFTVVAVVDVAV